LVKILFPKQSFGAISFDPNETSSGVPSRNRPSFGGLPQTLSEADVDNLTEAQWRERLDQVTMGGYAPRDTLRRCARKLLALEREEKKAALDRLCSDHEKLRLLDPYYFYSFVNELCESGLDKMHVAGQSIIDDPETRHPSWSIVMVHSGLYPAEPATVQRTVAKAIWSMPHKKRPVTLGVFDELANKLQEGGEICACTKEKCENLFSLAVLKKWSEFEQIVDELAADYGVTVDTTESDEEGNDSDASGYKSSNDDDVDTKA